MAECSKCKFFSVGDGTEPCGSCLNWNKFKHREATMVKDCDNCKYGHYESDEPPCDYCSRIQITEDCWEPQKDKKSTPRKQIFLALDALVDAIEDLREQLEADDED